MGKFAEAIERAYKRGSTIEEIIILITELEGMAPRKSPAAKKSEGFMYTGSFEGLWLEFPRHPNASKLKAFESWERLSVEDQHLARLGAKAYDNFLKGERRRRADYPGLHLATYLNQRRWESLLEPAELRS